MLTNTKPRGADGDESRAGPNFVGPLFIFLLIRRLPNRIKSICNFLNFIIATISFIASLLSFKQFQVLYQFPLPENIFNFL